VNLTFGHHQVFFFLPRNSFILKSDFQEKLIPEKCIIFFYIWHCHEKQVEKYFLVFEYAMKNELKNNLLIF
jgi:hypothetical protein